MRISQSTLIHSQGIALAPPDLEDPVLFLEEDFKLPPLPAIAQQVMQLIQSGKTSAKEVGDLLQCDVSLVSQILKIVNSAYYGLSRTVNDVNHAVAYLGLHEVHRLVLTASVMNSLVPKDIGLFEAFWYHSFHSATTAKMLAERCDSELPPEEVHVAALLHDVGKLVYLKFFPTQLQRILDHSERFDVPMIVSEETLGLPTHQELGATLCARWGLPEVVSEACLFHELRHLRQCNEGHQVEGYLRIVCLGNLLSNLATDMVNEGEQAVIRDEARRALDCNVDDFLPLMTEVHALRSQVDAFLAQLGFGRG